MLTPRFRSGPTCGRPKSLPAILSLRYSRPTRSGTTRVTSFGASANNLLRSIRTQDARLTGPLCRGVGRAIRPAGWAQGMAPTCRRAMDGRKARHPGSPSLYSGRPALRPAGRLRRPRALPTRGSHLSLGDARERGSRAVGARNRSLLWSATRDREAILPRLRRAPPFVLKRVTGPTRCPPPREREAIKQLNRNHGPACQFGSRRMCAPSPLSFSSMFS